LVGGGSGLGLYPTENGYYGSCLGYTVKSPQVVWARRITGADSVVRTRLQTNVKPVPAHSEEQELINGSTSPAIRRSRDAQAFDPTSRRRTKVLYIVGSHRCGSTLLARLLGDMPGFFAIGEGLLHFLGGSSRNRVPCGCGMGVQDCSFWNGISRPAEQVPFVARWLRLRRVPLLGSYCRRHPQEASELISSVSSFYDMIAQHSGAEVIVDSSKSPFHARLLSLVPDIELYIVYLVRDPRNIVASSRKRKEWIPGTSPLRTTKRWLLVTLGTEYVRSYLPKWHTLRYEDFVKAPRDATVQIAADLGCKHLETPFIMESVAELGTQHMLGSNPDKLKRGPTRIAEKATDLSWLDRAVVSGLTAPFLWRYGYWGSGWQGEFQVVGRPQVAAFAETAGTPTKADCEIEDAS